MDINKAMNTRKIRFQVYGTLNFWIVANTMEPDKWNDETVFASIEPSNATLFSSHEAAHMTQYLVERGVSFACVD